MPITLTLVETIPGATVHTPWGDKEMDQTEQSITLTFDDTALSALAKAIAGK